MGGRAVCWDATNNYSHKYTLTEHAGIVRALACSPDSKRLVSAGYDTKLLVWDVSDGKLVQELKGHQQPILGVAFSPSGATLCSVAGPLTPPRGIADDVSRFFGAVRVWDIAEGRELAQQKVHEATIYAVTFTADGSRFLTGSADQTLRVWDAATRQHVLTIAGTQSEIHSVASTIDGAIIVTGGKNGTVFVFDGRLPNDVKHFSRVGLNTAPDVPAGD